MRALVGAIAFASLAACGGDGEDRQAAEGGNGQAAESANVAASGSGAAAAVTLQPGQWEITTEVVRMDVPNLPQGVSGPTPPATTVRTCLTPQQASAPSGGFLTGSGEGGGCTTQNMSMAGGRIRGTVECTQPGSAMRSSMDGQFSPTSFEVEQQVETSAQGMEMTIQSRTRGRRVGDCPG